MDLPFLLCTSHPVTSYAMTAMLEISATDICVPARTGDVLLGDFHDHGLFFHLDRRICRGLLRFVGPFIGWLWVVS